MGYLAGLPINTQIRNPIIFTHLTHYWWVRIYLKNAGCGQVNGFWVFSDPYLAIVSGGWDQLLVGFTG